VAIAIVCVLVNNVLLITLDWLSVRSAPSVLISAVVMIPLSFGLHARLTYAVQPTWAAFRRYAAVLIVNTPLAWLLLLAIHDLGKMPMIYAAPIVTLLLFLWNFSASTWALLTARQLRRLP
jgi:putative flippase GtrA